LFDINAHIAKISDKKIEAVVKPAFTFFKGTPYYPIIKLPKFTGAGIYALYLTNTENTCYCPTLPSMYPIYIGKAAPKGSRQGKKSGAGTQLKGRLAKHLSSIRQVDNLDESNFVCRFMILQGHAEDMISAMESYLIRQYNPLWNSYIDGFGINAPGAGRYNQSPSEWDTLHPGRYYAAQLTGELRDEKLILSKVINYKAKKA
jgi:hypothetical protein